MDHQEAERGRTLADYEDDALMARIQSGDKEAYAVLVGRHAGAVLAIATRFLSDRDAGKDVVQEVFLDLWVSRARYVPSGRFRSFLATLALNRCRDAARRRRSDERRRSGYAVEAALAARDPAEEALRTHSSDKLLKSMAKLDEQDREILVMRYAMDLSYDEISVLTEKPAGTLRSRVFHALRKLRSLLEGEP